MGGPREAERDSVNELTLTRFRQLGVPSTAGLAAYCDGGAAFDESSIAQAVELFRAAGDLQHDAGDRDREASVGVGLAAVDTRPSGTCRTATH